MPSGGTAHHRGVGDPAGDDDVGATIEGVDDAPAAQVCIGADEAGGVADRLAGLEVGQIDTTGDELPESGEQIVAIHVGNGGLQAQTVRDLRNGGGAPGRVQAAGVGDDLDPLLEACHHDLLHLGDEAAGISASGAAGLGAGEDQHRQLGQPVAGENVDGPAFDHLLGSRKTVAVEAGTVGDSDRIAHDDSPPV